MDDLLAAYPDKFDNIGNFPGQYCIMVDRRVPSVIHAPRQCPILMIDEVKLELDRMLRQGIIGKFDEPTDWVSRLIYVQKANGKLRLCLDLNDLNHAIKRCHHHTPMLEELTHKFAGSIVFSKLDAKNGYWSIKLDQTSQLLTVRPSTHYMVVIASSECHFDL